MELQAQEIASTIDHTLLQPTATEAQIQQLCKEAIENSFFAVCVNSHWVPLAAKELKLSKQKVAAVVGFPLGANAKRVKAFEAEWCLENGASEIDMVVPVGLIKSAQWVDVESDIAAVVRACTAKKADSVVKVILEVGLLTPEETVKAAQVAEFAGAHFVKTSTGFLGRGAEVADIELLRKSVKPSTKIKASGGIRNLEQAQKLIVAGAQRLGTSQGVAIIKSLTTSASAY